MKMEKYSVLGIVGEGSYGKVMKCRHQATGQVVAIKKFIETEEDSATRKMALREIRMLKKLHHPNLVSLLEVFRRRKRFHLVFEYMTCNLLNKLDDEGPLSEDITKKYIFQVLRGIDYCHSNNIIHRDIKPENILLSEYDVVKLCDFGFARFATISSEPFTDYVATRWYRAPELLVGDITYGRSVDIWAVGCIVIEMLTGDPLFAGDTDIDQLYQITRLLGGLTENMKNCLTKHVESRNSSEINDPVVDKINSRLETSALFNIRDKFPDIDKKTLDMVYTCIRVDPKERLTSEELLKHKYFTRDEFLVWYLPELEKNISLEWSTKQPLSEQPCIYSLHQDGPVPRRPTKTITDWSIDLVNDPVLPDPKHMDALKLKEKKEGNSVKKKSGSVLKEISRSEDSPRKSSERDGKRTDIERMSKKSTGPTKYEVGYKRHMIPKTIFLKPVGGRLHFDKDLKLLCKEGMEKPSCEDLCLPRINRDFPFQSTGATSKWNVDDSHTTETQLHFFKSQTGGEDLLRVCKCEQEVKKHHPIGLDCDDENEIFKPYFKST